MIRLSKDRGMNNYFSTIRIFTISPKGDILIGAEVKKIASDGSLSIHAVILGNNNQGLNQGLLIVRGIGTSRIRLACLGGGIGYDNYYLQCSFKHTIDSKVIVIFESELGRDNYYTGAPNGWGCLTCSFKLSADHDEKVPTVCPNCGEVMSSDGGPRTRFGKLPGKIIASCYDLGEGKTGNIALLLPSNEVVCVTSQNITDGSVIRYFYIWDGVNLLLTRKDEIVD